MDIYTIYRVTNKINGKIYIGFTQDFEFRIKTHERDFKNYDKDVSYRIFYSAISKYGWKNFEWEVIYQSKELDYTKNVMEKFFIEEYKSFVGFDNSNGYNMTLGGEGSHGRICKKESKEKAKISIQKYYEDEENRKRHSKITKEAMNNLSPDKKQRMSDPNRGIVVVKRAKTGEIIGRVPVDHEKFLSGEWVSITKGFKHSLETRQRMSESRTGLESYIRTDEIKQKFSKSRTGKGTGERNAMAKEENRIKVGLSKVGRKKYINTETSSIKMCLPGTEPEGYILSTLIKK